MRLIVLTHAHMDSDYFTDDRDALLTQLQEELDGIIRQFLCRVEDTFQTAETAVPLKYEIGRASCRERV